MMMRGWWDRMNPRRSFKGDDFWEGGDEDEDEGGKWKGWRRRRRRRFPEKWTYLDAFLIFKILTPYDWSLPLILLLWLEASGSLVLSFALSAAALVVQLVWPGTEFDSRGSDSKRNRRSADRVSRRGMAEGWNDEMRSGEKRASAYDSWLECDLNLGLDEPSVGGWVDLEEERFSDDTGQREGKIESSKGSRESLREVAAEAEAPLLLRLLIAMFPLWPRGLNCFGD